MIKLEGSIEGCPVGGIVGTWRIADRWVSVLERNTVVADAAPPRLGAAVVVIGHELSDGTVQAILMHIVAPPKEPLPQTATPGSAPLSGRADVAWSGVVEAIDGEVWSVGRYRVIVPRQGVPLPDPAAAVGDIVELRAIPNEAERLVAQQIQVVCRRGHAWPIEITGRLRTMPSTLLGWWLLEHDRVLVTEGTVLAVHPREGDRLVVFGQECANGVILAEMIVAEAQDQARFSRARQCVLPPYLSAS